MRKRKRKRRSRRSRRKRRKRRKRRRAAKEIAKYEFLRQIQLFHWHKLNILMYAIDAPFFVEREELIVWIYQLIHNKLWAS